MTAEHQHHDDVHNDYEGQPLARAFRRLCWPSLLALLAIPAGAQAHGIAGNRLFPGTLTFDDPAVADEFTGPILSRQKHPVPGGPVVLDTSVSAAISRILIPGLAIGADSVWTEHDADDGSSVQGIGATHLSVKGQLYENDPHETLLAASLSWGVGGVGNPDLHAHTYNTLEPGLSFGRGFGDLPHALGWLRPFGIAGGLVVDFPLAGKSRRASDGALADNPIIVHTGFALEYSTLYLTDRFTGGPPTEEPLHQFVPLVEFQFDSPLNGGFGTKTAATVNPGLSYTAQTWQVSAEAIVPLNSLGGSAGFRVGVLLFLDDLIPSLFGRPVFH